MRQKVFPPAAAGGTGDRLSVGGGWGYSLIAASISDLDQWLHQVPEDRPTLVVFEGLTMYLSEAEGKNLLQGIVSRFGHAGGENNKSQGGQNEIICDALGSIIIRMQSWFSAVSKEKGAVLDWAIDDPELLCREEWCKGRLELGEQILAVEMPGVEKYPWGFRVAMGIAAWVPGLRNHSKFLRYRF